MLFTLPAMAGGKDFVIFKNGDRVTGEIKGLSRGVLTFSTDYSENDYQIKWEDVRRIESNRPFIFTLQSGERVTGSLATESKEPLILRLRIPRGPEIVSPKYP